MYVCNKDVLKNVNNKKKVNAGPRAGHTYKDNTGPRAWHIFKEKGCLRAWYDLLALVNDVFPPATAIIGYVIGLRKLSV